VGIKVYKIKKRECQEARREDAKVIGRDLPRKGYSMRKKIRNKKYFLSIDG